MKTVFVNGSIFDGNIFHEDKTLLIENDKISSLEKNGSVNLSDKDIYDLQGGILAPGFIDVQVNGGGGVMFNNSPSVTTLKTMINSHRKYGTTSIFPTLITTDFPTMLAAANSVKQAISDGLAGIRGIHFEGPYLSKERKGVHDEKIIRAVDEGAIDLLTQDGLGVAITTLAPENVLPEFIQTLSLSGVRVCVGHSAATYEEMCEAFSCGVTGITHLFNAMSQFESRAPGIVGAALENENCWCGIIADGYHVHPATLRTAIAAKAPSKIMLVTDAMATVGAVDKRFILNGEEIVAKAGRCATAEGTLAGSDLDMASAVRYTVNTLKLPVSEALRMASLYPAEFTGLSHKIGRLKTGYQADLVHLNSDLIPQKTWIGGE